MTNRLAVLRIVVSLVLLLAALDARASADYPLVIRGTLALGYTPECTLCHADAAGADGRVVTEFGLSMQSFGMKGGDPESLRTAIATSRERQWDTDGDGTADIEELVRGVDPNGPALARVPGPQHGCAVAPMARSNAQAAAGWLGALLWLAVQRRSRRPCRSSLACEKTAADQK